MARAPVDDASKSSKAGEPMSQSGQRMSNSGHVEQRTLAGRHEPNPIQRRVSVSNYGQDAERPIGIFEQQDGLRQPLYRVPGSQSLLSLEPHNRSTLLSSGPQNAKRVYTDESSSTEEPKSTTMASRPKRRAVRKTPSVPKPKSQGRSCARNPLESQADAEEEDESVIPVSTTPTHETYIGDADAMAFFYYQRLQQLNQKLLKKIVTRWLLSYAPDRKKQYGSYTKKRPGEMKTNPAPPWWPKDSPYVEPSHLKSPDLLPLAVDLMLIHRKSDIHMKRDGRFTSWIMVLKQHADYILSTLPAEEFGSSKVPTFIAATKDRAFKVVHDLFQAAQSHEDHMIQNELFEETGNKDSGNGKYLTWTDIPKQPRVLTKDQVAPIPDGSGDETEVDEASIASSQMQSPLTKPAPQPLLHTPTLSNSMAMMDTSQQPGANHPSLDAREPPFNTVHGQFPLRNLTQTPSSLFDQSNNRLIPVDELHRTSEPHAQVFSEPQSSCNHPSCNPFGLQDTNRDLYTFPSQPLSHFVPASGPELNGYHVPNLFQSIPTTATTAGSTYSAQPGFAAMYIQEPRCMSYPSGQGYSLVIPPGSPIDSKVTIGSCNTSFSSMCSDVDMKSPDLHEMPYATNIQQPLHDSSYCNCRAGGCICSARQGLHYRC